MRRASRKAGQAIVEFALMITLIFFLLSAAVDLGLIFFALQGMYNAEQEGAMYGSRWVDVTYSGSNITGTTLRVNEIRNRVRGEAGARGGVGFVNLIDLNNNGINDSTESGVLNNYILVSAIPDTDFDGKPEATPSGPGATACNNLATSDYKCYIRIEMRYDYRPVFPLAPALGDSVEIRRTFVMPMRATFRINP